MCAYSDPLALKYTPSPTRIVAQPSLYANFSTPPYLYIRAMGQNDIEGGILKLEKVYLSNLQEQYSNTILIQIALLVVAVVLAGVYIFFMLLPFMQEATTETRRCVWLRSINSLWGVNLCICLCLSLQQHACMHVGHVR